MIRKTLMLLVCVACHFFFSFAQQYSPKLQDAVRKLNSAIVAIDAMYVDTVKIGTLAEDAIRGMLAALDPHSTYTDAEETKEEMSPLEGKFGGIGVQFNMLTDTVYVVQVIPGGPSEKAGILPGDRIISVDAQPIAGLKMKNSAVMTKLRGSKGSKVKLGILRAGILRELLIVRGDIPVNSREASYMIPGTTIGYLRFSRFSRTTFEEFVQATTSLRKAGMKSMILDLRYNGGGLLDQAQLMTSAFLKPNSVILTVKNSRLPYFSEDLKSNDQRTLGLQDMPVVILVNEFSASASEILAGAIQDHDRGMLVGRRTFGKGLVQRPIPLADGSMIRLTIARYYTPSGRSIQKPYKPGDGKDYEMDIMNRYKHGEFMHADSIQFPDSLKYRTLVRGRTVYGGGGIMPDIFVPIDTTRYNTLARELFGRAILLRLLPDYFDTQRSALKTAYTSPEAFIASYQVPDALLIRIRPLAEAEKLKWDDTLYLAALPDIKDRLKQFIARELYGDDIFYRLINEEDKEYMQAVDLLKKKQAITP